MSRPATEDLTAPLGVPVAVVSQLARRGRRDAVESLSSPRRKTHLPQIAFPSAVVRALVSKDGREQADDSINPTPPDSIHRGTATRASHSMRGPLPNLPSFALRCSLHSRPNVMRLHFVQCCMLRFADVGMVLLGTVIVGNGVISPERRVINAGYARCSSPDACIYFLGIPARGRS